MRKCGRGGLSRALFFGEVDWFTMLEVYHRKLGFWGLTRLFECVTVCHVYQLSELISSSLSYLDTNGSLPRSLKSPNEHRLYRTFTTSTLSVTNGGYSRETCVYPKKIICLEHHHGRSRQRGCSNIKKASFVGSPAPYWNRTSDLIITSDTLYH